MKDYDRRRQEENRHRRQMHLSKEGDGRSRAQPPGQDDGRRNLEGFAWLAAIMIFLEQWRGTSKVFKVVRSHFKEALIIAFLVVLIWILPWRVLAWAIITVTISRAVINRIQDP